MSEADDAPLSEAAYLKSLEALRYPHPIPLDRAELENLREMVQEWKDSRHEARLRALATEERRKKYPIIFAAISAIMAAATFIVNFLLSGGHKS